MPRRFSDIERGPLLNLAYQARQAYANRDQSKRGLNIGKGTPRSPVVFAAVAPFGIDLPSGVTGYRVRTNQRNRTQLGSAVGARAVSPPPNTATFNGGFTPAKIKLFVKSGTPVPETSKITGLRYARQSGTSYMHPYGQTATEREFEAFESMAIGLLSERNLVTYAPEKFSLRE